VGRRTAGEGTVRRLPNGRYQARRKIGSRESAVELSATGATSGEAIDRLKAKVAEHRRRLDVGESATWTVPEYLSWWTGQELPARVADGTLAPATMTSYEVACRLHLSPRLQRVKLAELRAGHVRELLNGAARAGLSARHRRHLHATLRAAMSTAVRYEYVDRNPVSLVPAPAVARRRKQPVTVDEAKRLLEAAAGTRLYALWRLLLTAPLRPGEPLAADWDAFDLDAGVYRLRRNLVRHDGQWLWRPTKGKRERTVPLPAVTVEALRQHRVAMARERLEVGTGWVGADLVDVDGSRVRPWLAFTYPNGSPIHQTWLQRELGRLCEAAKVPRLTPHQLRSAAVTLLTEQGEHPRVVQQAAGHADLTVSDLYVGALDEALRAAVDKLAERLG